MVRYAQTSAPHRHTGAAHCAATKHLAWCLWARRAGGEEPRYVGAWVGSDGQSELLMRAVTLVFVGQ